MKSNIKVYHERQRLNVNIFLLFYLYVFFMVIIANLLSVSFTTYLLFLIFGIAGICILFIKVSSHIYIDEKRFSLYLKFPVKVLLLTLNTEEISVAEEVEPGYNLYKGDNSLKIKSYYKSLFYREGKFVKLTKANGEVFIISCRNSTDIITYINSFKSKK